MPELDYAVLCDYVRTEGGIAHVIAAGIDTVYTPDVPAGQNVGLLMRVAFTRNECGRPHRVELIFQDADGERLAQVMGVITPEWQPDLPPSWRVGALLGLNIGVPLPRFGLYAFEVLINDSHVKTIPLRVIRRELPAGEATEEASDPDAEA
jgi:hypothetical protein